MQDAGLDVVALCDTGGTPTSQFPNGTARVVAQFGYDAYGSVVTAETLFAHALVRAGHKGLFFDRLDLGVADPLTLDESPRLAVGADLLGYARNRVYSPRLGRWVQRDPNGAGASIVETAAFSGTPLRASIPDFDLPSMLTDGHNVYGYLSNRNWTHGDPLGLVIGIDDLVMIGFGGLRGGTGEMVGQYADNAHSDVEWAMDWQMDDEWHTRLDSSWVELSFAVGFYRGAREELLSSLMVRELDYAVSVGSLLSKGTRRIALTMRQLNSADIFPSYHAAKRARHKSGIEGSSHHALELQIGRGQSWRKKLNDDGPAVNIDRTVHLSEMRNRFNAAYRALGITRPNRMTQKQAEVVVKHVYHDVPRLRNATLKYIRGRHGKECPCVSRWSLRIVYYERHLSDRI